LEGGGQRKLHKKGHQDLSFSQSTYGKGRQINSVWSESIEENRLLVRPKRRWQENINTDINNKGYV